MEGYSEDEEERRVVGDPRFLTEVLAPAGLLLGEDLEMWVYDYVLTRALDLPSLTVEFLPTREEVPGEEYYWQWMILGTDTQKTMRDYLLIARFQLPNGLIVVDDGTHKLEIVKKITHDARVIKARHMPGNPNLIATKTSSGLVYVFDHPKHASDESICDPDLRLRGQKDEGLGLCWSKLKPGHLLSCGDDAQICLWDINGTPFEKTLDHSLLFKAHDPCSNDVAWHSKDDNLFGSVGHDGYLLIWDLRAPLYPAQSTIAHQTEAYCLAFNDFDEYLVATGSADNTVKLFDRRKLHTSLFTLNYHENEVNGVGWNPRKHTMLASSDEDGKLLFWDHTRIGQQQNGDKPPELLFIHKGGHKGGINDFSWDPSQNWVIASVCAEDPTLEIWNKTQDVYDMVSPANQDQTQAQTHDPEEAGPSEPLLRRTTRQRRRTRRYVD